MSAVVTCRLEATATHRETPRTQRWPFPLIPTLVGPQDLKTGDMKPQSKVAVGKANAKLKYSLANWAIKVNWGKVPVVGQLVCLPAPVTE